MSRFILKLDYRRGERMQAAIHKACGTQLAWYHGDRKEWPGFIVPPGHYIRMNGTQPDCLQKRPWVQAMFRERCEACNRMIGPMEIELRRPRTAEDVRRELGI